MATWKALIKEELAKGGEAWDDVVASTLSEEELNAEFDDSGGPVEGSHFTLWTKSRVYFPVEYDGSEWVASAPRDPCGEKMEHL